MTHDEELIQRLRDKQDIKKDDLKNNSKNIEVVNEGTIHLTYEFNEKTKKDKDNEKTNKNKDDE